MSAAPERASLAERLESMFVSQSLMTIWGVPVVIGILLIWSSAFVEIHSIYVPPLDAPASSCSTEQQAGKQVGLWSALNWPAVDVILFPLYLMCMWFLAGGVRNTIDDLVAKGAIKQSNGRTPSSASVHDLLTHEIRLNNGLFLLLLFAVGVLTVGGWWYASGRALVSFAMRNEVIDWSTAIIRCDRRDLQVPVLIYTFVAYLWMGIALFVYLACLAMGFIYAVFLSKVAFNLAVH